MMTDHISNSSTITYFKVPYPFPLARDLTFKVDDPATKIPTHVFLASRSQANVSSLLHCFNSSLNKTNSTD